VPADPTWPEQAARLTLAAGERAQRIDHIGSTAVPGLPGRDVLDLQAGVASMVDADALAGPLAEAGLPVVPGFTEDAPHPSDGDPAEWRKRVHASADPVRWATVHERVIDSAGWRYALMFRDWLRAEPDVLADYARIKQKLAAEHASRTTGAYADAKQPWFAKSWPALRDWAARTNWSPETVNP
jgi:dephospho-CoA kinase